MQVEIEREGRTMYRAADAWQEARCWLLGDRRISWQNHLWYSQPRLKKAKIEVGAKDLYMEIINQLSGIKGRPSTRCSLGKFQEYHNAQKYLLDWGWYEDCWTVRSKEVDEKSAACVIMSTVRSKRAAWLLNECWRMNIETAGSMVDSTAPAHGLIGSCPFPSPVPLLVLSSAIQFICGCRFSQNWRGKKKEWVQRSEFVFVIWGDIVSPTTPRMAAWRKSFGKDRGAWFTKIENQALPLSKIYTGAPNSGIEQVPRATGSQREPWGWRRPGGRWDD